MNIIIIISLIASFSHVLDTGVNRWFQSFQISMILRGIIADLNKTVVLMVSILSLVVIY